MEVKVIRSWKAPYAVSEYRMVNLGDAKRLTPKLARFAMKQAFEGDYATEVWDIANKVGYRVYGKSARKIKWTN